MSTLALASTSDLSEYGLLEDEDDDHATSTSLRSGKFYRRSIHLSSFAVWQNCCTTPVSKYASQMEIAIRAAVMSVVFVAPFIARPGTFPVFQDLHAQFKN